MLYGNRQSAVWTRLPDQWPSHPHEALIALEGWLREAAAQLSRWQAQLGEASPSATGGVAAGDGNGPSPRFPQAKASNAARLDPDDLLSLETSLQRIPPLLSSARERLSSWEVSLANRGAPVGLYSAPGSHSTAVERGQSWGEG